MSLILVVHSKYKCLQFIFSFLKGNGVDTSVLLVFKSNSIGFEIFFLLRNI